MITGQISVVGTNVFALTGMGIGSMVFITSNDSKHTYASYERVPSVILVIVIIIVHVRILIVVGLLSVVNDILYSGIIHVNVYTYSQ